MNPTIDTQPATQQAPASAIALLDPKRSLSPLEPQLVNAFVRVLRSGCYILGPEVEAFEQEVADFCGVPHAIGLSSGTDALLVALMALNIDPGDEVICPTYTFFATAGSIWRLGARPVFVDCCPGCFNMLPHAIERHITPRTKAIMPVHLFGQMAAMAELLQLSAKYQLPIIEDAAQALGAKNHLGTAGCLGLAGCFSFFPSKNLGGFGDAGMLVTADADFAQKVRLLRSHGAHPKYHHARVGGNFRLDALQAALLRVKLPQLTTYTKSRIQNAALYDALFIATGLANLGECLCEEKLPSTTKAINNQGFITLPARRPGEYHIYNQYTVAFATPKLRNAVRQALQQAHIGCEIYYPIPLHQQACFEQSAQSHVDFPHAQHAASCSLALPVFPELTELEIERVVHAVSQAVTQACQT